MGQWNYFISNNFKAHTDLQSKKEKNNRTAHISFIQSSIKHHIRYIKQQTIHETTSPFDYLLIDITFVNLKPVEACLKRDKGK